MVRVFRELVEFNILAFSILKDNGYTTSNIIQRFKNGTCPETGSDDDRRKAYAVYRALGESGFSYHATLPSLIDEMHELVKNPKGSNMDGMVIDEVVELLGLSFARNQISNKVIKRLRRMLLFPEEIATIQARVEQAETHCAGCNREIIDQEMVTLSRDGENVQLYCIICVPPSYVPCRGCQGVSDTPKSVYQNLKKVTTCPTCNGKNKILHPPPEVATQQEVAMPVQNEAREVPDFIRRLAGDGRPTTPRAGLGRTVTIPTNPAGPRVTWRDFTRIEGGRPGETVVFTPPPALGRITQEWLDAPAVAEPARTPAEQHQAELRLEEQERIQRQLDAEDRMPDIDGDQDE